MKNSSGYNADFRTMHGTRPWLYNDLHNPSGTPIFTKLGASPKLECWNTGIMEYWVLGEWIIASKPVQTSLLTGCYPAEHGIVANGVYDRTALKVEFWEQPAGLPSSQWIVRAAHHVLDEAIPDLMLVYMISRVYPHVRN